VSRGVEINENQLIVYQRVLENGLFPYAVPYADWKATWIEQATCGLRNSDNPPSDNLTPQETTNQAAPDIGGDGAGLSCPGSSVVADEDDDQPLD